MRNTEERRVTYKLGAWRLFDKRDRFYESSLGYQSIDLHWRGQSRTSLQTF